MRIAMIGSGLCGSCFWAHASPILVIRSTCVDKDNAKISALKAGEIPIYEPGLKEIVQSNVWSRAATHLPSALSDALKWGRTQCSSPSEHRHAVVTGTLICLTSTTATRENRRGADRFHGDDYKINSPSRYWR